MSWFNKRKVTIDTKKEDRRGMSWTLVDNEECVVQTFFDSRGVVQYLYDDNFKAKEWIDEKVQYEVSKELEKQKSEKYNKQFTFFLDKDVAPLVLNKMDAMECVWKWEIKQNEMFPDMVEVKYYASKQVLFQTETGVVVKED